MPRKIGKSVVIGAMIGLAVGLLILILAWFNDRWESEMLRTAINFSVSMPILIFSGKLNIPDGIINIFFFAYWIVMGGVVGQLLGSKQMLPKIILIVLVVGLVILHRIIQLRLEHELGAALEAFGELFKMVTGGIKP